MGVRHVFVSAILLSATIALPACQRASGGPLQPKEGSGVRIEGGNVALLTDGALETRVTGRWSSTGSNALRIRYRNGGAIPLATHSTEVMFDAARPSGLP